MNTLILTMSYSIYTCRSISLYKTFLFVFAAPCFIILQNLDTIVMQLINSSKVAHTRSHKWGVSSVTTAFDARLYTNPIFLTQR